MAKKYGKGEGPKGLDAIEGIFSGLSEIIAKLGELAQTGEKLEKTGSFDSPGKGKDLKGVYGFSIKVGAGGEGMKVEPFGNIRKDRKTGESVVQEVHEPITDIFEEEDHLLIVAEMPGIDTRDIHLDIQDDILTIRAESEDKRYMKEILLPADIDKDGISISSKNGIVKITAKK